RVRLAHPFRFDHLLVHPVLKIWALDLVDGVDSTNLAGVVRFAAGLERSFLCATQSLFFCMGITDLNRMGAACFPRRASTLRCSFCAVLFLKRLDEPCVYSSLMCKRLIK